MVRLLVRVKERSSLGQAFVWLAGCCRAFLLWPCPPGNLCKSDVIDEAEAEGFLQVGGQPGP